MTSTDNIFTLVDEMIKVVKHALIDLGNESDDFTLSVREMTLLYFAKMTVVNAKMEKFTQENEGQIQFDKTGYFVHQQNAAGKLAQALEILQAAIDNQTDMIDFLDHLQEQLVENENGDDS